MDFKEIQASTELANYLYDFLPANPHPYADLAISFPGCAAKVGIANLWKGGSKKPAVAQLLKDTLENARNKFCPLINEIVKTAILYRMNKGNPITKEEIEQINKKILDIGFKIPELWDKTFLDSLPQKNKKNESKDDKEIDLSKLKEEYFELSKMQPQARGYAFQIFLNKLFASYNLAPKGAFRIVGEEIDGSFELDSQTYLLEAKWQAKQSGQSELLIFNGKVEGKSTWARGIFISYIGFTKEGLEAFTRGKRTSIIGMDGQDIYFILEGKLSLIEAIRRKARRAVETNDFFVSVYELI